MPLGPQMATEHRHVPYILTRKLYVTLFNHVGFGIGIVLQPTEYGGKLNELPFQRVDCPTAALLVRVLPSFVSGRGHGLVAAPPTAAEDKGRYAVLAPPPLNFTQRFHVCKKVHMRLLRPNFLVWRTRAITPARAP